MHLYQQIFKYLIAAILSSFLDFIWISSNFKTYNKTIRDIQGFEPKINVKYALICTNDIYFHDNFIFHVAIPFTMQHIDKNDKHIDNLYKSMSENIKNHKKNFNWNKFEESLRLNDN